MTTMLIVQIAQLLPVEMGWMSNYWPSKIVKWCGTAYQIWVVIEWGYFLWWRRGKVERHPMHIFTNPDCKSHPIIKCRVVTGCCDYRVRWRLDHIAGSKVGRTWNTSFCSRLVTCQNIYISRRTQMDADTPNVLSATCDTHVYHVLAVHIAQCPKS